jgi:hypothetical protein
VFSPLPKNSCKQLLFLTEEGLFQLGSYKSNILIDEFILSPYSRVSFLGCWLIFSKVGINNKLQSKFIFKDSLSSKDYSRLRRIIMALKW